MRAFTAREQRLIAVGLLLCTVLGAWNLVLMPLVDGFLQRSQQRDDLRAEYLRNDRILAGLPVWRTDAQKQSKTAARFGITAPNKTAGVEILRRRLSSAAVTVGGTVLSQQEVQANLPAGWIGVQGDLRLSMSQMKTLLERFQNEEPYVVVDYLTIGIGTVRPGEPQTLAVRLAISAPLRSDAPPSGPRKTARHA